MNFGSLQLHVQRPDMQGLFDEHAQRVEMALRRTARQVHSPGGFRYWPDSAGSQNCLSSYDERCQTCKGTDSPSHPASGRDEP